MSLPRGKWRGSSVLFHLGIYNQCYKGSLPLVTFSQIKSYSRLLSAIAEIIATSEVTQSLQLQHCVKFDNRYSFTLFQ